MSWPEREQRIAEGLKNQGIDAEVGWDNNGMRVQLTYVDADKLASLLERLGS